MYPLQRNCIVEHLSFIQQKSTSLYSIIYCLANLNSFPGLQPSTPLTKHLSRWGVRVNLREGDRKRPGDSSGDDEEVPAYVSREG